MTARTTASSRRDLPNLDLLRAIAVLLVLANHVLETIDDLTERSFHPYDWYAGRLGVLLFFVHTSLVLMASMERLHLRGWELLRSFYIRRAFRIYPLSIFCVLIVMAFDVPVLPWLQASPHDAMTVASNLLLTTNLTQSPLLLGPLWSLPLEVQMYLLLPVMYLFLGDRYRVPKALGLFAAAVAVASQMPTQAGTPVAVLFFAPCFAAGVVAYTLRDVPMRVLPGYLWPAALAVVIAAYFVADDLIPGIHPGPLQWFACLVVGLMIPAFHQIAAPSLNAFAHHVAKYSYGIYLFHCVALWVGCYAIDQPPVLQGLVVVSLIVVMSVLSFHLLEQPLIRYGARVAAGAPRADRASAGAS